MLYSVNKQLRMKIRWKNKSVDGEVRAITQPLHTICIASFNPIPADEEFEFSLYTEKVPLIKGKGTVNRAISIRNAYHYGLSVAILEPETIQSITERLAPFVSSDVRPQYMDNPRVSFPNEQNQDWIKSWIDSSYRMNLLLDLIARINSTMDIDSLISAIMQASKVIMEAEESSLMTIDQETGNLKLMFSTDLKSENVNPKIIPKGKGISGWVVEHEKPIIIEDAQKDPRFFGDLKNDFQTKSMICVPMKNPEGKIIGVLEAINKKDGTSFKESDIPLFASLADQAAISLEKARLYEESLKKKLLEQQLEMAREIQERFWPKEKPEFEGLEIEGMSVPATHVGGDYYDFIKIDDDKCALVIGDICGKGVPASLLMATLRSALQIQLTGKNTLEETLFLVNNMILKDTPTDKFVTLFVGILDVKKMEFTYVNAGHNPPYLFDKKTNKLETLIEGGPIIGFMKDFEYKATKRKLDPNQCIVMYTDGVTEAMNKEKVYFGEDRLERLIKESACLSAYELMKKIYSAILKYSQGTKQYDDITMVILNSVHP